MIKLKFLKFFFFNLKKSLERNILHFYWKTFKFKLEKFHRLFIIKYLLNERKMNEKPMDSKTFTMNSTKTNQMNRKISSHNQRQSVISKDNLRDGFFRKAIPIMPSSLAIFCMVLNIILPGIGKRIIWFDWNARILKFSEFKAHWFHLSQYFSEPNITTTKTTNRFL